MESLGIERSLPGDGGCRPDAGGGRCLAAAGSPKIESLIASGRKVAWWCGNKCDLGAASDGAACDLGADRRGHSPSCARRSWKRSRPKGAFEQETGFITSLRHEQLLRESPEYLEKARGAVEAGIPHEMLLLDLYAALRPIDAITGATTADDILNRIFSTFCIGK